MNNTYKTYKPIPKDKPKECRTFGQYLYSVVHNWGVNSVEFQTLLKFHTKDELREIYLKEAARRKTLKEAPDG